MTVASRDHDHTATARTEKEPLAYTRTVSVHCACGRAATTAAGNCGRPECWAPAQKALCHEFTPGPWTFAMRPSRMWHIHSSAPNLRSRAIAFTAQRISENGIRQNEANARLIAAAPDLLEALKAVDRQVFCDCPEHSHCITHEPGCFIPILRAALAKATGDAS